LKEVIEDPGITNTASPAAWPVIPNEELLVAARVTWLLLILDKITALVFLVAFTKMSPLTAVVKSGEQVTPAGLVAPVAKPTVGCICVAADAVYTSFLLKNITLSKSTIFGLWFGTVTTFNTPPVFRSALITSAATPLVTLTIIDLFGMGI
jgi:hypothetical protein